MSSHVPRGTNAEPKPQAGSKRLGRGLAQLLAGPLSAQDAAVPERAHERVDHAGLIESAGPTTPSGLLTKPVSEERVSSGGMVELAVSKISPGKYQPRKSFDEGALEGLAESIGHSGVMQPIVVRPIGGDGFEIVAGERRWRAAVSAGLQTIPAMVRTLSDLESAEWSVTENLQREVKPVE